ncbi:hypothetical protein [Acidaminococcus massiliensis]|uniref:hypothetical protein n=1 Tax=Acidaminococcus massiliensis TaxID=1852375 RepID=UPI0023F2D5A8|nr:hypothetical protein [Acidaminococcus massiliensis]
MVEKMSLPGRTKTDIEIRDWVFAYSPDLKQWLVGKWMGHNKIAIVTQETSPRLMAVDVVNDGFYAPLAWTGEVDRNGHMLFDFDQIECAGVIATIVWETDKREWMIIPWRGDKRLEDQRLTDALGHGEWEKL